MGLAETIAELNRKLNRVTKEQTPEPTDSVGWRNLYIKGFPIETTYSYRGNKNPIFYTSWEDAEIGDFKAKTIHKFRLKENNDTETGLSF